jgi:predicted phage terminase large subunit-like protein
MELNSSAIYSFASKLLWSKFDNPVETPDFHFELWDLLCSPYPNVAVAAPRKHAKTTAGTVVFSLACLLFRVKSYILIISDTEGQAIEFLENIKRELLENEALIETFKIERVYKNTDKDVRILFKDGHKSRIMAFGSEQKVRGRLWNGRRPDLIVCDDMENDEQVMNEERRHKFQTWFLAALGEMGSSDCHMRVFGTILHQDSMLNRLMPKTTSPTLKTDGLRFWDDEHVIESGWKSVLYQAHNEDFSLILWPENYGKEYFIKKRQQRVFQGRPELYAQEMLNRPIDDSIAYFRKDDLLEIRDYREFLEYYVGVDCAISEKDRRAYTAIVVAGLSASGILKVVDVRRFRGDSLDICNELFSVQTRYNPVLIGMEKENISKSIGPFLYEQMGREGKPFLNLHLLPIGNQDKERRARSIQARIRAGRVEFDHKASWWPAFLEEMIYFPRGSYADQVDALAWIGIMLDKMVTVLTDKQKADNEYERDKEESEVWDLGLSAYGD